MCHPTGGRPTGATMGSSGAAGVTGAAPTKPMEGAWANGQWMDPAAEGVPNTGPAVAS
jgi:hypothetical protein